MKGLRGGRGARGQGSEAKRLRGSRGAGEQGGKETRQQRSRRADGQRRRCQSSHLWQTRLGRRSVAVPHLPSPRNHWRTSRSPKQQRSRRASYREGLPYSNLTLPLLCRWRPGLSRGSPIQRERSPPGLFRPPGRVPSHHLKNRRRLRSLWSRLALRLDLRVCWRPRRCQDRRTRWPPRRKSSRRGQPCRHSRSGPEGARKRKGRKLQGSRGPGEQGRIKTSPRKRRGAAERGRRKASQQRRRGARAHGRSGRKAVEMNR